MPQRQATGHVVSEADLAELVLSCTGACRFHVYSVRPVRTVGYMRVGRYTTNLTSGDTFYTDANGREMQKRVRDYRPSWDLNVTQPVAGNYYPLTAAIFLEVSALAWKVTASDSKVKLRYLQPLLMGAHCAVVCGQHQRNGTCKGLVRGALLRLNATAFGLSVGLMCCGWASVIFHAGDIARMQFLLMQVAVAQPGAGVKPSRSQACIPAFW